MEASDNRSGSISSGQSSSATPQPPPSSNQRRGGNGSRASGRSRPRASLACMNCRQRKIKCNFPSSASAPGPGASSCSSCRTLQIPCELSRDGDRRKAGSREQVSTLQDRVQYLESLISQDRTNGQSTSQDLQINERQGQFDRVVDPSFVNSGIALSEAGSAPQWPVPGRNLLPVSISPSLHGGQTVVNSGRRSTETGYHNQEQSSLPFTSSPVPHAQLSNRSGATNNLNPIRQSPHNTNYAPPAPSSSGHMQPNLGRLSPSSEKERERLEFDENYGRPRFYGPTSQLYIKRKSTADAGEHQSETEEPTALSIDSAPLRAQLFHTFWRIAPHSVVIVDETSFEAGRALVTRSEYYSTFLENALLSCATRMSTSGGVRALGSQYAARAKSEIAQELEYSNIATLQGFLLLSDFEATRGRDRLGYMYCGIACRLIFDLGLPESCDGLVTQGKLSTTEATFRHTLLLGAFIYDKLWSMYLGRPGAIPIHILELAHERSLATGWSGPPTLVPWVGLCTEMTEVTDILNSPSPLDTVGREQLVNLDTRIHQRHEALPDPLRLYEDRIAELPITAYGLHIQFCGLRIVLHRLLSKALSQADGNGYSNNLPISDNSHMLRESRTIMHESAVRIARLISTYQQICGIENVITVMLDNTYVAAAVLVSHLVRLLPHDTSQSTYNDLHWLRCLSDMLAKAQKHYPVTVRMRATLASFVENSSLAGTFGTFSGAGGPSADSGASSGQSFADCDMNFAGSSLIPGRPQDYELFENYFGEGGDPVFQDMDLNNMISWVLSPTGRG